MGHEHERHEHHEGEGWHWARDQFRLLHHALSNMETRIMAGIKEFAAKVQAHMDKIDAGLADVGTSLTGVGGDVEALTELVQKLQGSPGTISDEDQATLDAIEARLATTSENVTGTATKIAALDALTPPPAPSA